MQDEVNEKTISLCVNGGQAVPSDGRSEQAAPFCRGKLQVIRRSYRAA